MNQLLTFDFDRKLKASNAVGNPEVHGFSDEGIWWSYFPALGA